MPRAARGALLVALLAGAAALGVVIAGSRDDPGLGGSPTELGSAAGDAGARWLERPRRRRVASLLARGNVALVHSGARPPAGLAGLAEEVGLPYSPALAAAGQAVVLVPGRVSGDAVVALAQGRELRAASARDPRLRDFIEAHLGRAG